MSLIDLTPEYNLLEDYEQNDLVISVIDDLKLCDIKIDVLKALQKQMV